MKESFTLPKLGCKTFDFWNKIVSRHVLHEKLGSLVGVLHIPVEIRLKRKWVVAPQPQRGSFRDSDVAVRLGHWLGSWNINIESANSAKQKSLFKVKPEQRSMYGQDSKMEQCSLSSRSVSSIKVNTKVMVEQWRGSELLSGWFPTGRSLMTGGLESKLLSGWGGMTGDIDFFFWWRL